MSLVNTVVTPAQVGLTSCHFYLEELCPEPIKIKSTIYEEGPRPLTLKVREREREMFSEGHQC
ncbi:hypothetical protein CROQUDRAFT_665697 [Cronartium quercuum f. sp. fusiforme G11]|uniref:Uncharacterized protein n=1 Tax=Cronartium quercuum f. sp. fusiforme G11 TaxID=708437 RepID=A0A9P6T5S8_9BASI|nr:hypothetical protein CROQUDRAFT_665697 [Cronartium quercuum f. sp. fusiforme G11]